MVKENSLKLILMIKIHDFHQNSRVQNLRRIFSEFEMAHCFRKGISLNYVLTLSNIYVDVEECLGKDKTKNMRKVQEVWDTNALG